MTTPAAFEAHLRTALGLSDNTVVRYTKTLAAFGRWLRGQPASHELAISWLSGFQNARSKHVHAAGLKAWYSWVTPRDPLVIRVRTEASVPKPIPLYELRRVVAFAQGLDRLIVLTLAFSGLRISEFNTLTHASLEADAKAIRVVGKGAKERVVPIAPSLYAMLGERAAERLHRRGGYLFPGERVGTAMHQNTVRARVAAIGRVVGVAGLHPHTFRHFYATWFYHFHPRDIDTAGALGHAGLGTTKGYVDLNREPPPGVTDMESLLRGVVN